MTQHRWISVWAVVAAWVVICDVAFVFTRPKSYEGGELHWLFKPFGYGIYPNIDLLYGQRAFKRGEALGGGFVPAKSVLNLAEVLGNLVYLYKTEISPDPIAPIIGFSVASATIAQAILYWLQEYFCNYCATGHNPLWTAVTLWWIPTGLFLVLPVMVAWTLGGDIAASLRATGKTRGHSPPRKLKKKHQ